MSRKSPAFTIFETIIACALAILAFGLMISAFISFRRQSETPLASMNMDQSTIQILRWFQREISETNLQSIRSLDKENGVILESARDTSDNLTFNPFGGLAWKKFVYFQVKNLSTPSSVPMPPTVKVGGTTINGPQLGELNYDEDPAGVGVEASQPTSLTPASNPGRHRLLGRNFLIENPNKMGCFVYYNDNAGNPQLFTDTQRGEPVCVALTLMEVSGSTGKPTIRKIFLQIKPKN